MTTFAPTTAEALRAALASTITCSAQELQEAVGQVVVATADELPQASALGPEVRSVRDVATHTLVLLSDRIPAGQEAQTLAQGIERHYGRQIAEVVLGDRTAELLGAILENHIDVGPRKLFHHDGGEKGFEVFFLEETPRRLAEMAIGNAFAAQDRDLSMRPKEYWETRPSPAKPHHWTAEEFAEHLARHNYPGGTIDDRMRWHVLTIRNALVQGDFVPAEVMAAEEGRSALADASMEVKSLDEGAYRLAQQKQASTHFDSVVSSVTIEKLVVGGAKLAAQAKGAELQPMVIENYPRPVWCVVDEDRVLVKDSGWPIKSLYGTIYEIDRGKAESIVRKALLDSHLSFDDSLWFMGSDWRPFSVVSSSRPTSGCESAPDM